MAQVLERKRIGGVPHKKLPCVFCGEPIWVHHKTRRECGDGKPMGDLPGVGRSRCDCTHEQQYTGDCSC